jgi:hypothetical protein
LRKERQYRNETVEKGVRKIMGDSSDTAVDVITVELSIHSITHFLGSAIMERHERVKFEKGVTIER